MQGVQKACDMTVEQISDAMLAGLEKLVQGGKDLSNIWDSTTTSFVGIVDGYYNSSYGHGGTEDFHSTVMRVSRSGPKATYKSTLTKMIAAIDHTLKRKEFVTNKTFPLSEEYFRKQLTHLKTQLGYMK